MKFEVTNEITWCTFGVLVSILIRICTTLHPYSGQGKPPMFGDYEAQRHWMEITVNLPMNQWYHNNTHNDLQYWGLDYPPLTAYHSYLCGLFAYLINPKYVELYKSRGFESEEHKLFMRYTALIADVFLYVPIVILYFILTKDLYQNETTVVVPANKNKKPLEKNKENESFPMHCCIILALLYPGLILIDHGHFQYNCVSLGLAVLAITLICVKKNVLSAICFCLALNYKQMELYHAFPFFIYLLSCCIPKPGENAMAGCKRLIQLSLAVIVSFGLIWLPFLFNTDDLLQVLHRLFPVARGVFEDKVANVWCALNIFYKFNTFCQLKMVRYCAIATLTAILPSSADLFLRPNIRKFVPALINSSLAFFLFSFQVHEKSILLVAIPVLLYFSQKPVVCFWFLFISNLSMLPLFIKDCLMIAFISTTLFFVATFWLCYDQFGPSSNSKTDENTFYAYYKDVLNILVGVENNKRSYRELFQITYSYFLKDMDVLKKTLYSIAKLVSFTGCIILIFCTLVFHPPPHYPDLYPLLISIFSCIHFICFFVYFNVVQFQIPQCFEIDYKYKFKND